MPRMVEKIAKRFPYLGLPGFLFQHFFVFLIAVTCWQASQFVRRLDFLEIPLLIMLFPLAPFFDPNDAMLHDRRLFPYAILFWILLIPASLLLSRMKVNPVLPAIGLVLAISALSIAYTIIIVR